MREKSRILITCALIMLLSACREVYQPPATNKSYSYLVVEGIINPDSTTVTLSRTRNLNDTISFIPELNAGISIESTNGSRYALNQKGNGVYSISGLALNLNDKYRLNIVTAAN